TISKKFNYERGCGKFLSAHEVEITSPDGSSKIIYGNNIVIATGSSPRHLPDIEADEKVILTSDGIDEIEDFPKSLVIVGAGVIGCEYATIFSNFGKTKVYIIDRQNNILPYEDDDVSKLIDANFDKTGVTIHHNANVVRMERIGNEVEY